MASFEFEPKSGHYHIRFRHGGKPFKRALHLADAREAERVCGVVEETIKDLKRGRLEMPEGADAGAFLISGGKVTGKPNPPTPQSPNQPDAPMTLGNVFAIYKETLTPGSKERNTMETEAIHARHITRVLGHGRVFEGMDVEALQLYVNARSKEGVSRDTICKEMATLRAVWGWAFKRHHVGSPVTWKVADLTLPKATEKPPFQTWEQIARRVRRDEMTEKQQGEQWEGLWLDQKQTMESLTWVEKHAVDPFIYPMFAFAAYTGARRGEMLRSDRDDWDFEAGVVSIRQKKADNSKKFTRRSVPIHPALASVMTEWFRQKPGFSWTISTIDGEPIGERMATRYFRRAVKGGKWEVLRGWHVYRHSLASNMAGAGADQRDINAILGHHTEEMERRYRHLCPRKQEQTLHTMFRA